jgi:hypothetical protein
MSAVGQHGRACHRVGSRASDERSMNPQEFDKGDLPPIFPNAINELSGALNMGHTIDHIVRHTRYVDVSLSDGTILTIHDVLVANVLKDGDGASIGFMFQNGAAIRFYQPYDQPVSEDIQ